MFGTDRLTVSVTSESRQDVVQLTNISRPVIGREFPEGAFIYSQRFGRSRISLLGCELLVDQSPDVILSFAQGWNVKLEDRNTVIEVFTKRTYSYHSLKVA